MREGSGRSSRDSSVLAYGFRSGAGFKVSGQYSQGNDWFYEDPVEVAAKAANPTDPRIGNRDFDQKRWGGEARLDLRPWDDGELIFNAGINSSVSSIELTGIGAGQADDWTYSYVQTRLNKGGFFGQVFLNSSNAGDTYLLRTGQPISDESKFFAGQLQYALDIGERQEFITGFDAQFTRPQTLGTITGRNEDDDDINEIGGYLHSTTALSDNVDLVAALRIDSHNRLEDLVFSPRAALVFRPNENQNLRVTFNRAFSTPTTNNLFLDLKAGEIPIGTFKYDIRTLGTPESGFTFNDRCQGGLGGYCMYSPFAPGTQLPANGAALWDGVLPVVLGGAAQANPALMPLIPTLTALLSGGDLSGLQSLFRRFNQEELTFVEDQAGPTDIERMRPTITNTIEVGYKGLVGGKFLLSADLYRTQVEDFVGPLRVETPSVFLDPASVGALIQARLTPLVQQGAIDAATLQALVPQLAAGFAQIPLGVVAPDQSPNSDLILAYRNFGDVDFWGFDMAGQFLATDRVSITGSYSHVSEECFDFDSDGSCTSANDISLNAPSDKGSVGVRFDDERSGFSIEGRARFTASFPVNSGVYIGEIESYAVFDANFNYQLPFYPGASFGVTASNLFNNEHQEFIGAPEIGRLVLTRLQFEF